MSSNRPDYHSVHAIADPAYRCERELIPGRMCLAPAEFAVELVDGQSHALAADMLGRLCAYHLGEHIRYEVREMADEPTA